MNDIELVKKYTHLREDLVVDFFNGKMLDSTPQMFQKVLTMLQESITYGENVLDDEIERLSDIVQNISKH